MTDGYLSRNRPYIAAMQRQRRAKIVRIDYMPSDEARGAIESMRARSPLGSASATNSAVIDAIVTEWAKLTGINYQRIEKPETSGMPPEFRDQNARTRISAVTPSPSTPKLIHTSRACAHARTTPVSDTGTLALLGKVRARMTSAPENEPQRARVICGARRRRDGQPCQALSVQGKRRCKWHGGCSTGPRTDEGRARALANLRQYAASVEKACSLSGPGMGQAAKIARS
jgi:hypothetical protein